jgi:hypothetical protein
LNVVALYVLILSRKATTAEGRAMAQAVSRRPPTAEAWAQSRFGPCGICGGQSGIDTGFSPSTSVFPCQFHSTGAPLLGKGLHNKPQGCGASVASTAKPFSTTKKNYNRTQEAGLLLANI